ncbi:MAG: sigma-70 family RNA polymerase sigma factor [Gemmatimonadota bacterium]|nr:sigma-70 family RNA polymerase sigma factor [Gemmatimonadota bacterium]
MSELPEVRDLEVPGVHRAAPGGSPAPSTTAPAVRGESTDADFDMLIRNVLGPAFGTALRMTGNRQDAEDLVQEASLAAYRGFVTFQPGTNFKAWFFRIMMNCYLTSRRRARQETSMQDLEDSHAAYLFMRTAEAGLHARFDDPAGATIGQMAQEDVASALKALPEEFRVVCTLYFMEDLAYQEIADILRLPVGTVRSRLHRGRKMLQKRLWAVAEDQGIVRARSELQMISTGTDA